MKVMSAGVLPVVQGLVLGQATSGLGPTAGAGRGDPGAEGEGRDGYADDDATSGASRAPAGG
jgi:hypothetical protein